MVALLLASPAKVWLEATETGRSGCADERRDGARLRPLPCNDSVNDCCEAAEYREPDLTLYCEV